jgi:hypothetical protein
MASVFPTAEKKKKKRLAQLHRLQREIAVQHTPYNQKSPKHDRMQEARMAHCLIARLSGLELKIDPVDKVSSRAKTILTKAIP